MNAAQGYSLGRRWGLARPIYLASGGLCVGLAVLGAMLPLLPTTPFLLLASWCFSRSSPRMHGWLTSSPLLGPFLRDWQRYRGVRLHVKLIAWAMMALVAAFTIARGTPLRPISLLTLALVAVGACVISRLRTIRD